ncbi:NAD(P)-binding protein, partial [Acidimicrobiaceae bacterium USS-CC1]|nr:NAD(P)-binding protein [Acidiferrimicrobium australe]
MGTEPTTQHPPAPDGAGPLVAEVDVLVVGAGLSGIGAACHLRREVPGRSVLVLEARDAIGGTWDLFRYPGVRSDSDINTLSYSFRRWRGDAVIADGATILDYIRTTAAEHGVDRLVRFGRRVLAACWSSADARWEVEVERAGGGRERYRSRFLYLNTGYFRYDRGHTPELPGLDRFAGPVVHPQR